MQNDMRVIRIVPVWYVPHFQDDGINARGIVLDISCYLLCSNMSPQLSHDRNHDNR